MLLIYPPVSRSTEPPLGIARLAGDLRGRGLAATCLDLNQEGLDYLLALEPPPSESEGNVGRSSGSTWARGALKRRGRNLDLLRQGRAFESIDRYRRVVLDLNQALKVLSAPAGVEVGLADYRDPALSPLCRPDLARAAEDFESNVFYPLFSARLEEAIAASKPLAVGLSICFLSQALCAFAMLGFLRKAHPELSLVVGGSLVSSWVAQGSISPEEKFGGLVDAVLPGWGEDRLADFLMATGRAAPLLPPPSPAGRPVPGADLSDFFSLRYFSPTLIAPYNFSWGCPWKRCVFCPEKAEGGPYRASRPELAMRDIASLAELFRPGLFHFTDSELSAPYLRALAASPPPAPWYGFARFSPLLADRGFCAALARSGCVMLQLGLESGDQAVLDALDKGIDLEVVDRALEGLAEAGITTFVYLLFGTPAEDRSAALRTRDFVAARADRIGYLNVAIFNLPATSAEVPKLETRPYSGDELSLYREFRHPAGWDRPAVRSFLAKDFEIEPGIAAILARNPPIFTSSHAALFRPLRPAPSR